MQKTKCNSKLEALNASLNYLSIIFIKVYNRLDYFVAISTYLRLECNKFLILKRSNRKNMDKNIAIVIHLL